MARGKRAGAKPKRQFNATALLLCLGVTLCVIAWGYLVYAAIDFGTSARAGTSGAWGYMSLAALGAVACLFTGLMLIARIMRVLGITSAPTADGAPTPPPGPRVPGGRRAAR